MAAKPDVARGELSIDDLKRQLEETQQHQAATSELLEVIRRSASDFQAVLDALMAAAARLCGVEAGGVAIREGEIFRYLATVGMNAEFDAVMRGRTYVPGRGTTVGRVAIEKRVIHIVDVLTDPEYEMSETVTLGRLRTILSVPMMRDGDVVGAITLTRRQVEPFSEPQIALIKTFADQAVIAMENARLLTETREALEQQTATAEVLGVINSSPSDLTPVFEAILEKAHNLCGAALGSLVIFEGERWRAIVQRGYGEPLASVLRQGARGSDNPFLQSLIDGAPLVHIGDLAQLDHPIGHANVAAGIRTLLVVALRKDHALLGTISIARREPRSFTGKQIALLQNFAQQAVIAMDNARLLTETREALEQQTATAEVLQVINSSPGDLSPVFDAMLEKAVRLCDAAFGLLWTYDADGAQSVAAHRAVPAAYAKFLAENRLNTGFGTGRARVLQGEPFVHVADVADDEPYRAGDPLRRALVDLGGVHTTDEARLRRLQFLQRFLGGVARCADFGLGALPLGDVAVDQHNPAARYRVAAHLDDPAIRARPLGRPLRPDLLRQPAHLRFDIDRAVFAMRSEIADKIADARPLGEKRIGQFQDPLEIQVPRGEPQFAVEHRDPVAHIIKGHAQLG